MRHPHTHGEGAHGEGARAEGGWAPSRPGSVALDIGAGVGALVVLVPAELGGYELEVAPMLRAAGPLVHTAVRERLLPGGTVLAAVFQRLTAGRYLLYGRAGDGPLAGELLGTPTITEGQVTELDLGACAA